MGGRGVGKGGPCVGLQTLPSSCADCLEILGPSASWNPQSLSRPVMGLLDLYLYRETDTQGGTCHPQWLFTEEL